MKPVLALLLLAGLACLTAAWAQQPEGGPAPTAVAKASPPTAAKVAPVNPGKRRPAFNADLAYKANCTRCHVAPRKFSERATVTIMRHMRVRANLTQEEAEAILQYLTQ